MTESQTEKRERQRLALKNKALELVVWFDDCKMPTEPVKVSQGITIVNIKKHNDWVMGILKNGDNPYSPVYVAAYNSLLQLQKFIQNESTGKNNSQP